MKIAYGFGRQRKRRAYLVLALLIVALCLGTPNLRAASKPSVPLGLIVRSGDQQNRLSWVASLPKPAGYNIYRASSKGGSYDKINSDPITQTSYSDTSYPRPGIYFYKVTAVAQDGTESDKTASAAPLVIDILASVKAKDGASINASIGEFELVIPPGSVKNDLSVRIQELIEKPKGPEGRVLISSVYECSPGGTKFAANRPATIRIKYMLPSGYNEATVTIEYYADGEWSPVKSRVITTRSMAEARIEHFTYFAVTAKGAKADVQKPIVKSVSSESSKTLTVTYSEQVDVTSALEVTNYSIISEPSLRVASASISGDERQVILTTTYQTANQPYKLKVTGVKDQAGNVIEDNDRTNIAAFYGGPSPHGDYLDKSYMCAACHRAHTGTGQKALTDADVSVVCYACHDSAGLGSKMTVQTDFGKISHHQLNESKKCTTCHNPHLSYKVTPKLLEIKSAATSINSGNEFCFVCHGTNPVPDAPLADHQTAFAGIAHDGSLPEPLSGTRIKCVHCHSSHGSDFPFMTLLFEEDLCFSCHRNKGSSPNGALSVVAPDIQSQYLGGPLNDPGRGAYYRHPTTTVTGKHSNIEVTQDGAYYANMGSADRHAECTDCHNPHASTKGVTGPPHASPQIRGVSGVGVQNGPAGSKPSYVFKPSLPGQRQIEFEYELCFKCHSAFAKSLPTASKDKSIEFNPNNASFHPVEAPGRNKTPAMDKSLAAAGIASGNQIFCSSCHSSDTGARGPHGSKNLHILKGSQREQIRARNATNDFSVNEFALCFSCHLSSPFTDPSKSSRDDTNFRYHGFHLNQLYNDPGANKISNSDDKNIKDAGHGNAICGECHANTHGSTGTPHLVRFSPNVNGLRGQGEPSYSSIGDASGRCQLRCHGKDHENLSY